ncbi:MAG: tRNA (adenosine(37)-N6)-threonylcarbamoyltransferase complex dimerization subunit type 1 TsaB [Pyrinomonadaceae bacterium]
MIVLGLDTSKETGVVALTKDGLLLGELALQIQDAYLQSILAMMDYLFRETHLTIKDVDLFTVVLGPGSWSGLRIGVTTAKSLAHGLNKPIVGVSTLDALAYNLRYTEQLIYPAIGAKRGNVFFAGYRCPGDTPQRFTNYKHTSIEEYLNDLEEPAVLLLDDSLRQQAAFTARRSAVVTIASPFLSRIRGVFINEAGLHKFIGSGADDTLSLAPLYLQEAEAEAKWASTHNR